MSVLQKIPALAGYDIQALKDQILERKEQIVTCEMSSVASIGEDLRRSRVTPLRHRVWELQNPASQCGGGQDPL